MRRLGILLALSATGCAQLLGISDPGAGVGPADDQPPIGDGGTNPGCGADPMIPTFVPGSMVAVASPKSFAVGLLNEDADPDLIVAVGGDTIVALGQGGGIFLDSHPLDPAGTTADDLVALGDFDGNGTLDVLTGIEGQSFFRITPQSTSGGFNGQNTTSFASNALTTSVFVASFDEDPSPDVAVGTSDGQTLVFSSKNHTDILTFTEAVMGVPCGAFDVDGDGLADLVLDFAGMASVVFDVGNGNFTPATPLAPAPFCHAVPGTFGRTGLPAIVAGVDGHIDVFRLSGGKFDQTRFFDGIALPQGSDPLQVLDVNGDGREDVFSDGSLVLACPTGPEGVAAEPSGQPVRLADPLHHAQLVDVNRDGKPDLLQIDDAGTITVSLQK